MKYIPIYLLLLAVLYGCASSTDLVNSGSYFLEDFELILGMATDFVSFFASLALSALRSSAGLTTT